MVKSATPEQMEKLAPYINGGMPDERGEVEAHCPLHGDSRRSASFNPKKGLWFCHAGCGGGSIRRLVDAEDTWKPIPAGAPRRRAVAARAADAPFDSGDVDRWHQRLLDDREAIDTLYARKGIKLETAIKARIGYNGRYFKIPIFSPDRNIWNVRTYDMRPTNGRRKIWSVKGMGTARLYPIGPLSRTIKHESVLICEGEWDTLLALQAGYCAVTRTDGAGKPWHDEWTELFEERRVYICPDRDEVGVQSAIATAAALDGVAQKVRFVNLPFEVTKKDGKDLSDLLLGSDHEHWYELGNLMAEANQKVSE
jgi:putative DNA primase/helicase